eukprot:1436427-Lingulodinium_polyedra.AAC.1
MPEAAPGRRPGGLAELPTVPRPRPRSSRPRPSQRQRPSRARSCRRASLAGHGDPCPLPTRVALCFFEKPAG